MSRFQVAGVGTLMKGRRLLASWLPADSAQCSTRWRRFATRVECYLHRHAIPERTEWVKVQQGLAQGLWIQIDLARERTWWAGTHEPEVQKVLLQVLSATTVFYDVGAHIGFFSLPAARLGARVIAFEPDPENAARLRVHIDRNHLEHKIEVIEVALWSDSVPSIIFRRGIPGSQGGIANGSLRPAIATGPLIGVRATKLDDFALGGAPMPQVIKMDVEGAASEVLSGATETIRTSRPILIIEVHTSSEYDGVVQFLDHLCYAANWDIPPEGFPRECYAFPPLPSLNRILHQISS